MHVKHVVLKLQGKIALKDIMKVNINVNILVAPQLVAIPNMVTMLKLHMLAQPALGRHA